MGHYLIGEVAEKLSISKDTLRYYDKLKLVSPKRSDNGYRYYKENDLQDIRYLQVMKHSGFKLQEIKLILSQENLSSDKKEIVFKVLRKKHEEALHKVKYFKDIAILLEMVIILINEPDCHHNEVNDLVKRVYEEIREFKGDEDE